MTKAEHILKWLQDVSENIVMFNQDGEYVYLSEQSMTFKVGKYGIEYVFFNYCEWDDRAFESVCLDSLEKATIKGNTITFPYTERSNNIPFTISIFKKATFNVEFLGNFK